MSVAVVIPAYNEGRRIAHVLKRIPTHLDGQAVIIVVVDDGSKDATGAKASLRGVTVVRHQTNLGKGAAAKTGCDAALMLGAEFIILMDADGQHRPEDLCRMVAPLLEDDTRHLVVGCRNIGGRMPRMMRLGNAVLTATIRTLFGVRVRDSQSGYRAFRASIYPRIRWISTNYAMETEMLILAARHGLTLAEVDIETIYLDSYKGTTALDGLRIMKTLLKWKIPWFQEFNSSESFSV